MPLRLTILAYIFLISFLFFIYSLWPNVKKYRKIIYCCIFSLWFLFAIGNTFIYLNIRQLYSAIENNNIMKIQTIIESKPTIVNTEQFFGKSPLHKAAELGNSKIIQLLITKGAECTSKDYNRATALHIAVRNNHKDSVIKLISHCNNEVVNAPAFRSDLTPLHLAALHGYYAIAEILLDNGADRTIKNRQGKTALDFATDRNYLKVVSLLKREGERSQTLN